MVGWLKHLAQDSLFMGCSTNYFDQDLYTTLPGYPDANGDQAWLGMGKTTSNAPCQCVGTGSVPASTLPSFRHLFSTGSHLPQLMLRGPGLSYRGRDHK